MLHEADRLLTVGEVALRLRQAESTVRRKINAGEIPAIKIGAGSKAPIRVDADELGRFLYGVPSAAGLPPVGSSPPSEGDAAGGRTGGVAVRPPQRKGAPR